VLNPEVDRPVILEGPSLVYDQIDTIAKEVEDFANQVLVVNRDSKKALNQMYSVVPAGPKDLTAEQKDKVKEFLARVDLLRILAPSDDKTNMTRLGRGVAGTPAVTPVVAGTAPTAPAATGAFSDDAW
jgi:hypothetical protein